MARSARPRPSPSRLAGALVCALLLLSAALSAAASRIAVEVFSEPGCPRCEAAHAFLTELTRRHSEIELVLHDLSTDPSALQRLEKLAAERRMAGLGVPAFLIKGTLIIGWRDAATTGRAIEEAMAGMPPAEDRSGPAPTCLPGAATSCTAEADPESIQVRIFGRLSVKRLGLPLFTVVIGLIDGTNPCAIWVLLYLLAILVNLHSRTKMLAIAGIFVLVSGIAYFAFMAAWLSFFHLVGYSRVIQIVLGIVAAGFGILNLKDAVALGHGPSLSIPERAKLGIYARMRAILQSQHMAAAMIGAAVLAVLVNMVELLCTAGLPALYTHILAARQLPWWKHALYLGLYNAAYILDDVVMLTIAIVTLSRRKLQQRGARLLKAVSGVVMLALGLIMLLRPQWLR